MRSDHIPLTVSVLYRIWKEKYDPPGEGGSTKKK